MKSLKYTLAAAACVVSLSVAAQSFTVELKNGQKVAYKASEVEAITFDSEDMPETVQAPRIGDYYYSDGTWSTSLNSEKTPIGIVFRTSVATELKDREGYYMIKDGSATLPEFHGYVVALKNADAFDDENGVWWSAFDASLIGGCSVDISDFLGYTNTQSVKSVAAQKGALKDVFPGVYYATERYEAAFPAPAQSSGWFMPSAGQFQYIYDKVYFDEDNSGRACVALAFEALGEDEATPLYDRGAEYWTSTEKIDSYGHATWAYYFNFDSSSISPGFVADYRKNASMHIRPILVF